MNRLKYEWNFIFCVVSVSQWTKPNMQVFTMLECVCYVCVLSSCRFSLTLYVRSVSINLDGVDTALGQASCLQKRTVVSQLHTLAGEVVSLEQLQPVVLAMLQRKGQTHSLSHGRKVCLHLSANGRVCFHVTEPGLCLCLENEPQKTETFRFSVKM